MTAGGVDLTSGSHGDLAAATGLATLLAGLVDDAGLYPPERLPLEAALSRHGRDAAAAHTQHSQRFVCPASLVPDIAARWAHGPLLVSLVADGELPALRAAVTAVADAPNLRLAAVELRLEGTSRDRELGGLLDFVPDTVPVWVEGGWPVAAAIPGLARHFAERMGGAKLRCGGIVQAQFPGAEELADAIMACAAEGLAWKATAGLHRAVRYTDPATGLRHHGFLNLLVATARATAGAGRGEVSAALGEPGVTSLVEEALGWDAGAVARVRGAFTSYGSCSTGEPVAEAAALPG